MSEWSPGAVILGEYTIEKELGRGGMGRVWLVKSQSTGRRFAVKQALILDEKHRKAFLTELQTWIDLPEHANIVPCRFFRTVGDEIVIFADFIEGGSLADWIAKGKLKTMEQILEVAIQFAWGLHAIHDRGFIHQDVKPGNVLMTLGGRPMVADFGLARARMLAGASASFSTASSSSQHSIPVPGAGLMTIEYASPEQRSGKPLTSKTDIWSWGVSVLDMFVGGVSCLCGGHLAQEVLNELVNESGDKSHFSITPPVMYKALSCCFECDAVNRPMKISQALEALISAYENYSGRRYEPNDHKPNNSHYTYRELVRQTNLGDVWTDPTALLSKVKVAVGQKKIGKPSNTTTREAISRDAQAIRDMAILQEARSLLEKYGDINRKEIVDLLAHVCRDMASVLSYFADWNSAFEHIKQAIAIYNKQLTTKWNVSDAIQQAETASQAARLRDNVRDYKQAIYFYDMAIAIWRSILTHDNHIYARVQLANTLNNKAMLEKIERGRTYAIPIVDEAIAECEALLAECDSSVIKPLLAIIYKNKADALSETVKFEELLAADKLYDEAISILQAYACPQEHILSQQLAATYWSKSNLLDYAGKHKGALKVIEMAVNIYEWQVSINGRRDLSPMLARVHISKGKLHIKLREWSLALESYDKADKIFYSEVENAGRTEDADINGNCKFMIYLISDALINECNSIASVQWGKCNKDQVVHRLLNAVQAFDVIQKIYDQNEVAPSLVKAIRAVAINMHKDKSYSDAVTWYDKAISMQESLLASEHRLSLLHGLTLDYLNKALLVRVENITQAMQLYDRCIELCETHVPPESRDKVQYTLGTAYLYKAQAMESTKESVAVLSCYECSIQSLRRAIGSSPNQQCAIKLGRALRGKADNLRDSVDIAEALFVYDECIEVIRALVDQNGHKELEDELVKMLDIVGRARGKCGDYVGAIRAYREVYKYRPDNADTLNALGWFLIQNGQHDEALQWCLKAIEISPQYYYAWDSMGVAYLRCGDLSESEKSFRMALSFAPNHKSSIEGLAEVLKRSDCAKYHQG